MSNRFYHNMWDWSWTIPEWTCHGRELRPDLASQRVFYLLDEIQHIKGWKRFCRSVREREKGMVFVTGSSSKLMALEVETALRGRNWSVPGFLFFFENTCKCTSWTRTILRFPLGGGRQKPSSILRNMPSGRVPQATMAPNPMDKAKLLKEYLQAMFFRDLVERYGMTNIALFDALSDKLLPDCIFQSVFLLLIVP